MLVALDPVLAGDNVVVCDALPITARGEVEAVFAGALTFTWSRRELIDRDAWVIAAAPADRAPVLVAHRCGVELATNWATAATVYPKRRALVDNAGVEPPF